MNKVGKKLALIALIAVPMSVNAKVGTMKIDSYNLSVGEIKTIPVMVSENVASVDGDVSIGDNSCLEIINVESPFGNGNYFANVDLNGNALTNAATITVKGLKECKTNIIIKNASIGSFEALDEETNLTFISNDITVSDVKEDTSLTNEVENIKEEVKEQKVEKTTVKEIKEEKEIVDTKEELKQEENKEKESVTKRIISILKEIFSLLKL